MACIPGAFGQGSFTSGGYLLRDALFTAIGVGLLVPAAFPSAGRGLVRAILGNPVLRWLGVISFGIYLYHFAVLVQLARWGLKDHEPVNDLAAWLTAALAGAVALAALSWYVIERPSLRLRARGVAQPRAERDTAPASARA